MALKSTRRRDLLQFDVTTTSPNEARLGRLSFPRRVPMETPHYVPASIRGTVPHLSQDNIRDQTSLRTLYTALEDYIERVPSQTPPIYGFPSDKLESPLRKFIALQRDALLLLGPRRVPPLPCPASSTSTSIAIVTSLGFNRLECAEYVQAVQRLRPDIVLGMGDVLYGHEPGVKRQERMADRTQSWLNALIAGMNAPEDGAACTALFAPILPIEVEKQYWYLNALQDDFYLQISGLVLHEIESVAAVPKVLRDLPRLFVGDMKTPHHMLEAIDAGLDLCIVPIINESTDSGFALDFSFGTPILDVPNETPQPLAFDMWAECHATDLSPLRKDCKCYTCVNHHRAYVRHLFNTSEMLAWVLLQLHNYHVMDEFFEAIRQSIARGGFLHDKAAFGRRYGTDWPAKTGQGPRIRGYQIKSKGKGEPRKNPIPYRSLNDQKERLKEATPPESKASAVDLEQVGFADMFKESKGGFGEADQ